MSRPLSQASTMSKKGGSAYRTVNKTSEVDESLFGSPNRVSQRGQQTQPQADNSNIQDFYSGGASNAQPTHGRRSVKQKEVVHIVTKDGLRTLAVPDRDANAESVVLGRDEFARICENAQYRSKSATLRDRKQQKERKLQDAEAAAQRRKEGEMMESTRRAAVPASELDLERMQREEEIRREAQRLIEEEEDEIRKMNEMILQAKVYAIRDAQMQEKKAIKSELDQEQRRLDEMMELERIRALKQNESKDKQVVTQRLQGASEIRKQIVEREQQRMIEEELQDQETQAMIRKMEQLRAQDEEKIAKKKEESRKLLEQANQAHAEALRLKNQRAEAERMEDLKAAQYLKEKQEREEEQEQELLAQKKERELEIARLRALQETAADKMAERQAIEAKRQQDDIERQWRRKEAEAARRQQELVENLQRARDEQVRIKEHFLALQTKQERNEFQRVLDAQKELIKSEEEKLQKERDRRRDNIQEVRQQISVKEQEKIDERRAFLEQGNKLDAEAQARRQKLDEIKQRKLEELKATGVDEKYMGPIIRMVSNPPKQTLTGSL